MNYFSLISLENKKFILGLLVLLLILFLFLVLSPFIPISPILYVTRAEKAMLYNNAGVNYYNIKNLEKAENSFKKAVLYSSDNLEYQNNLGVVLSVQSSKKGEAKEIFNKVLKRNSKDLTALRYLANMAFESADYQEAKEKIQVYININVQDAEAITLLGTIYYKLGNKEGAKEQWQKAIQINPNFETAKGNLDFLEQENQSPQLKEKEIKK